MTIYLFIYLARDFLFSCLAVLNMLVAFLFFAFFFFFLPPLFNSISCHASQSLRIYFSCENVSLLF